MHAATPAANPSWRMSANPLSVKRVQPKSNLGTKIFSHLVFGTDILVGEKIVLTGGYNVLRRRELRIENIASGFTGFSYGFNLHLQRLTCYYARTHYQSSLSHHQISFSFRLQPAGD
jgi:hypothetical protein